jgi:hypothetical protein
MGDKNSILSGTGILYTAAVGEAEPEIDDLTPPAINITVGGLWAATGFTVDDHEIEFLGDYEEVLVNEVTGACKYLITKEGVIFRGKFSEQNMTTLALQLGTAAMVETAAAADQVNKQVVGYGGGPVVELALMYVDLSQAGGSRVFSMWRAVANNGAKYMKSLKGHRPADFEFSCLSDDSKTAGEQLVRISDILAPASS